MTDEEIAGNDVIITDMMPLTAIPSAPNGVPKKGNVKLVRIVVITVNMVILMSQH